MWTVRTLKAHIEAVLHERDRRYTQRFTDLETATKVALATSEKAADKVATATEARFASVNEFRNTLADQAKDLITRAEVEANLAFLRQQVKELSDRVNVSSGKGAGVAAGWGYLVAGIAAVGTIVAVFIALSK